MLSQAVRLGYINHGATNVAVICCKREIMFMYIKEIEPVPLLFLLVFFVYEYLLSSLLLTSLLVIFSLVKY